MKKRLSLFLSVVFLFSLFSLPSCMIESSENLAYTITGETCTITGIGENKSRRIVIPSEIEGKRVTAIADEAFKNDDWLYSVSIPASVTYVGEYAFYDCDFLRYATIDMVKGSRIEPYAFAECKRLRRAKFATVVCETDDPPIFSGFITTGPHADFSNEKTAAEYLTTTYTHNPILPCSTDWIIENRIKYFNDDEPFIQFYQEEFKNSKKKLAMIRGDETTNCEVEINGGKIHFLTGEEYYAEHAEELSFSFTFSNADEGFRPYQDEFWHGIALASMINADIEIDLNDLSIETIEVSSLGYTGYAFYFGDLNLMTVYVYSVEAFQEAEVLQIIKNRIMIL